MHAQKSVHVQRLMSRVLIRRSCMEDTTLTPSPIVTSGQRRPWALMRQTIYGTIVLLVLAGMGYGIYSAFFAAEPTCADAVQNGDERGVDCGGACSKVCAPDVDSPIVQWARAFPVADHLYHAVAYVGNPNKTIGTRALPYTLTLEDEQGVIATRAGVAALPPDGVYPVFEGRIDAGARIPTRVRIAFDVGAAVWTMLDAARTDYAVLARELTGVGISLPRVVAQIQNNLYTETSNLRVVAIIYDSARQPLAASQTIVPYIKARSVADVVFTWPQQIAGVTDTCTVPDATTSACGVTPTTIDIIPVPEYTP